MSTWLLIVLANYAGMMNVIQQPDRETCLAETRKYLGQTPEGLIDPGFYNPPAKYVIAYCVESALPEPPK